ncbi:MAG: signal peptidase I [Gemmatimonadetes bacterium]|nr:signal peptidase I [Gemmatimonadota bacterium]MCB9505745.1 signal peptidase I [Gemmatimonadales bacterium]MCA9763196.1 signal peptidase I [Gemmatimonadota bacterium]MCA9769468.1 signal peptidase I [Gemmatimonadota bacterium]MCB9519118.1 signal peptidase I [Gemmatimonadales bacterium]
MAEPQATPKSKVIEWIKAIVWTAVAWVLLTTFVVQAYRIPSPSMERTLMVGDVLFVNKFLFGAKLPFVDVRTPAVREPRRDDIVVFLSPIEDSMLVKRLIGIPGDTVEMRQGALYRNGKALVEPWAQSTDPGWSADESTRLAMRQMQLPHFVGADPDAYLPDVHQWGPLVVPDDSLWMMGDNRDQSRDSRFWGLVPRRNVRGTPVLIYYSWDPFSYKPFPFLSAVRWSRVLTIPR